MERFEDEGKSIALIFDVSIRHAGNGRRIIDVIKKKMIDVVRELLVDGEDSFYLYHPQITETVSTHGEQVGAIGNYNSDGWKFNVQYAFKQSLYVLMAEPLTYRKYVFFITDRITDKKAIDKAIHINEKEMIDSHFFLIGVGNQYDKKCIIDFNGSTNITCFHLNEPAELEASLFKETQNGEFDAQCQTSQQHQSLQFTSGHNCTIPRSIRSSDAIDEQYLSADKKQLLSTDSCGRLQSQSQLPFDSGRECSEECGKTETNQYFEDNTD